MSDFIDEMINNSPEWVCKDLDDDEIEDFSRRTGYSNVVSRIMLQRGINTEEDLKHYLSDDIYSLINPFLFTGIVSAVNRVKKALHDSEKIFIFGDRDADGVLATAMLYNMLKKFDVDVFYKVPEGEYGYGIEIKDVDMARDRGVSLIITVDTGISSIKEIEYANSMEIDTIVIDHHVQPNVTPAAFSILNPKMDFETYPFKSLSAGGVVLKFIHAFILSHTKNFNRVFVPILSEGETVKGVKVINGIITDSITIEESIHYPIENNYTVVLDSKKKLPEYFSSWLKDRKIGQIGLMCSQSYSNIDEFARLFIKLFSQRQKKSTEFVKSFIDLSAISTISDIMPLIGENRVIVREGLKQITGTSNLGLSILLGYCNLPEREYRAKDIAWYLSPLINSAGRMGDAHLAVELFVTRDIGVANELSKTLIDLNEKRKEKGEKNFRIINPIIKAKYYKDPVIIMDTDKAEHGVTGIIASKIARKFFKPTIIIVNDGKIGIGSGRDSGDFDLVSLVARCDDLLQKYGGHKSAVGFTIDIEKIDSFRERIHSIVSDEYELFKSQETLEIDVDMIPEVIGFQLLKELIIFEPTGVGNRAPCFSISNTTVIKPSCIGKDKNHIKFLIPTGNGVIPVIGWGLADKGFRIIEDSKCIDIVFNIEDNYFRGERSLQLVLHDMRTTN
ncbi:MAG TPA: single-stranded-DNA-specific exonuclease RecJ [Spirochaetes bacterium]|nr:single-stranded-DNA-specific exonuclease RecJ [Spirochaetota bacterium]